MKALCLLLIASPAAAQSLSDFEERLEALRQKYHVAGMSAGIAKGQSIAWTKGFGLADLASNAAPTDTTVFHLASLTKPFAGTMILQLVGEGKVSLDDPVSKYGITLSAQGPILLRHLLSHTSEGVPGTRYSYSGNRFAYLDSVIARVDGRSFGAALQARIAGPLGLTQTGRQPSAMATGYRWANDRFEVTRYPPYFGASAGLTSTVRDYLAFSMALDRDALLRPATKALAFTPARDAAGRDLPYGLGWFTTTHKGERVIWHYGYWTANSSLIVKVPSRDLAFVLMANTDGLSSPFPLGSGRLETSDFARAFLDVFLGPRPPIK